MRLRPVFRPTHSAGFAEAKLLSFFCLILCCLQRGIKGCCSCCVLIDSSLGFMHLGFGKIKVGWGGVCSLGVSGMDDPDPLGYQSTRGSADLDVCFIFNSYLPPC